ncbi:hypothetical protein vseg_018894 [Gypsophila vaccaria]
MLQTCLYFYLIITFITIICPYFILLAKSNTLAPALYIFGDSLIDNGNNNMLPTLARANYAPYGLDFPGPVALGRFTNGRTFADFLAEYLGLGYPPAYASQHAPNYALAGYNYASAAGGILRESGSHLGKCYCLDEQIDMFKQTIESQLYPIFKDQTQLSKHLSKSIYLLLIGHNDYINNYIDNLYPSNKLYNPPQFAEFLIDALSKQIQRLYDLGVRKLILSEVCALGCLPTVARRAKLGSQVKGKCDEEVNDMVSMYNKLLPSLIHNFTSTHEGSYVVIMHVYSLVYDLIMNPANYGYDDTSNPCCTTWLNGTFLCIPELTPCSDPNKYFFWDGYHATESFYSRFVVPESVYGSSLCSPMNISQLVEI